MARVTIEDCVARYPNHYELTLLAAKRARQLLAGLPPLIEVKKPEKPMVIALREIAAGKLTWEVYERLEEQLRQQREQAEALVAAGEHGG